MNKLICILVFIIIGNVSNNKKEKVCWNISKTITWQNYRGKPSSQLSYDAVTTIAISYSILSKDRVSVENCIIESKSWVKRNKQTSTLLKHEQYHFNLAEVIARKMRMEISQVKVPTISAIQIIYNKWMLEFDKLQSKYDEETNHSKNETEQEKWQDRIDQELNSLTSFQNEIVILSCK